MIAYRVKQRSADLWPHSNSIFGAAVHKSQAELLTVNGACQHAQLIQRLCQAIVILCIETGGPDSPYTTVNGCICQWGFVVLAAMEVLLHNILEATGHWFCFLSLFCRGDVSTLFFFFFFLAELSVQFVETVDANKLSDKVNRSTGLKHAGSMGAQTCQLLLCSFTVFFIK